MESKADNEDARRSRPHAQRADNNAASNSFTQLVANAVRQQRSKQIDPEPTQSAPETIPARMLNEFVYCPRLFYYEHVEKVFVASADTRRGESIHLRVDTGDGAMPEATRSSDADAETPDTIHSRSVQMGSDRLGIVAKMDLIEATPAREDLFEPVTVVPVDYKAGAPTKGDNANEIWDTDRMQLGLQALTLRDNGYHCEEGVIYYRATKQRVRLAITQELEAWILSNIEEARRIANGPIPPPLENSAKCARCSLAPVCLPDETEMLACPDREPQSANPTPRRLIAPQDDRRALYLNTQGLRVGRKDEVLRIQDRDALVDEIRIRDLSHVALFGNIQVSTQAIHTLCRLEVPVSYFTTGGWFYGITRGHGLKNVFLRIKQFELATDVKTQLELSRQFVHGKIHNHRVLLMRNHKEPSAQAIERLRNSANQALEVQSLEALLGIEGDAARVYFGEFNGMIKLNDDPALKDAPAGGDFSFQFVNRNRRPPTDPINALLSLAYSVLSKDCVLTALAVGMDPYVGFFHKPRFGRPALALDLMEEFRPLVAESTVLNCVNNRVITERDFVRAGHAVNLTAQGRKRFFQVYEKRMSSVITHPLFDYKVCYRRALELQARILAKILTGEIERYVPLKTR